MNKHKILQTDCLNSAARSYPLSLLIAVDRKNYIQISWYRTPQVWNRLNKFVCCPLCHNKLFWIKEHISQASMSIQYRMVGIIKLPILVRDCL